MQDHSNVTTLEFFKSAYFLVPFAMAMVGLWWVDRAEKKKARQRRRR
jgi:hypothetical protein